MISGWLFDAYPLDNKMVLWIKQEDGNTIRLQDSRWGLQDKIKYHILLK
jgi:hypothetical protein